MEYIKGYVQLRVSPNRVTWPGSRIGGVLWLSWNLMVAALLWVDCLVDIVRVLIEELDEVEDMELLHSRVGDKRMLGRDDAIITVRMMAL